MKFICMGFIEESKYAALSEAEGQRMMEECFAYDDELRRGGHFIGGEALQSARNAVTLRMKDGSIIVTDGPYIETKEMLGGILLLEARDLNHAIALMSRHPGVKVGPFEIRPADEETNKRIADRDDVVREEKTRTVSISHRMGIKAPMAKVYETLSTVTGIARWWTREVSGESKVGGTFQVRFLNDDGACLGAMDIRVDSLQPDSRIQWSFESGPAEWIGTNVTFALKQEGEHTIVLFSHNGWREAVEFTAHCSMKWATFLLSLKQEVENGRGLPSPGDLKIDNWN
jgi:uncharacterized protein YndB with AHSA1/START domain